MGVCEARAARQNGQFSTSIALAVSCIDVDRHVSCSQLAQKTRALNEEPDKTMLAQLRVLEKKMGLVLTLVRGHRHFTVELIAELTWRLLLSSKLPSGVSSTSCLRRKSKTMTASPATLASDHPVLPHFTTLFKYQPTCTINPFMCVTLIEALRNPSFSTQLGASQAGRKRADLIGIPDDQIAINP